MLTQLSLNILNLDNNMIASIPYAPSNTPNTTLKTLILSHNQIKDWKSVDALALKVPHLESLSLTDCTIMNMRRLHHQIYLRISSAFTETDVGKARQSVIARFEKLQILNLSEVGYAIHTTQPSSVS